MSDRGMLVFSPSRRVRTGRGQDLLNLTTAKCLRIFIVRLHCFFTYRVKTLLYLVDAFTASAHLALVYLCVPHHLKYPWLFARNYAPPLRRAPAKITVKYKPLALIL